MGQFSKRPSWVTITGRGAAFCIATTGLMACMGEYKLFSVGRTSAPVGWHEYVTPRVADTPIEKAVLEVAVTGKSTQLPGYDIFFILTDSSRNKPVQCVNVVAQTVSKDPYAGRSVTRYRVIDGMISAMSKTTNEFFIDADLERAVMRAAAKRLSPDPVVIYTKGNTTMAIAAHSIDPCNADVRIYKGESLGGAPIASKRISGCFER